MKKKKPTYIKDSTIDMSDVKQVVNPELKKRNHKIENKNIRQGLL